MKLILIENWLINQAVRWALLFPTFSCVPTFPYFGKFPTYNPYFFILKCHLRDKNTVFFSSLPPILEISFFRELTAENLNDFEFLIQKSPSSASFIVIAIILLKYWV